MNKNINIVVYFAHLDIERSVINRTVRDAIQDLPHVNYRDLHELYPDFFIDVALEQSIMRDANLIVFQYPVYWYSSPAIIKHFLDTVFVRGFAYGEGGNALCNKDLLLLASTGAGQDEYQSGGVHHYPFNELILPIEQTARFCGMNFLTPLTLHGGHSLSREIISAHAEKVNKFLVDYGSEN